MYKIYLKNIKEVIEKRQEADPIHESNYLSAILKNKRIELKQTLSEITENICSEAFLSKVERNLMSPKNEKVALLCERLDLDYYKLINLETNNRIENLLYNFYDKNYDLINEMDDNTCDGVFIAQDEIIKSYKYLINKEYKKLHFCIIGLDNVKECLSEIELFALILVVYEYNFTTLQYNKALEYLKLLKKANVKNYKCDLYIKEISFILNCKMENNNIEYMFEEIKKDFSLYSMTKQFGFLLYYYETFYTEYAYNYIINMGNDYIPNVYKEDYNYAVALLLTKLNKNVDAMKYIIESGYHSVRFITLYSYNLCMYCLETDGQKEFKSYKSQLISLVKICKQNSGDTYHVAFLRLMQYEMDKNSLDIICNYIKNTLLKELCDFTYPLYDNYISDRYCLLLGKLSRYKDAYLFLLQSKIHLKK